jgi:hypothetical protein
MEMSTFIIIFGFAVALVVILTYHLEVRDAKRLTEASKTSMVAAINELQMQSSVNEQRTLSSNDGFLDPNNETERYIREMDTFLKTQDPTWVALSPVPEKVTTGQQMLQNLRKEYLENAKSHRAMIVPPDFEVTEIRSMQHVAPVSYILTGNASAIWSSGKTDKLMQELQLRLTDTSPQALDTLNELSAALNDSTVDMAYIYDQAIL